MGEAQKQNQAIMGNLTEVVRANEALQAEFAAFRAKASPKDEISAFAAKIAALTAANGADRRCCVMMCALAPFCWGIGRWSEAGWRFIFIIFYCFCSFN